MTKSNRSTADRVIGTGHASKSKTTTWTVPKGPDVRSVTRDASRQVIKHYGEALEKLKDH